MGHFHNSILGPFRAYATNEANTVVLKLRKGTIVVTPESPEEFVRAVQEMSSGARIANG